MLHFTNMNLQTSQNSSKLETKRACAASASWSTHGVHEAPPHSALAAWWSRYLSDTSRYLRIAFAGALSSAAFSYCCWKLYSSSATDRDQLNPRTLHGGVSFDSSVWRWRSMHAHWYRLFLEDEQLVADIFILLSGRDARLQALTF
jgi:hypothetical protein